MKNDLFKDIVGSMVVIAIIVGGIIAINDGQLAMGWIFTTCGGFIAVIAAHNMWRRYK